MTYAGKLPSLKAVKLAVREDLSKAPRLPWDFAVYIFQRAYEIEQGRQAEAARDAKPYYGRNPDRH